MSIPRDFVINFGSLAEGEHQFEFEIKDAFFKRFDHSIIEKGTIDVLVVIEKKDNMLLLDFTMDGIVTVQCDRCLEDIELEIEGFNELIVKIGGEGGELSEKVIVISSKEYEIDVAQYIYEFLSLIIPMRNVHDENGQQCDPEILKELEKHITNKSSNTPTDPRWDDLKNINLN